jgi:hypothetical protein
MVPAGSILGFPIDDERVAFGRVLSMTRGGRFITEVFRKTARPGDFDDAVLSSGFLTPPFFHGLRLDAVVKDGTLHVHDQRWALVRRGDDFVIPAPQCDYEFAWGEWPLVHKMNVRQEITWKKLSVSEARGLLRADWIGHAKREAYIRQAAEEGRSWSPGQPDSDWEMFLSNVDTAGT